MSAAEDFPGEDSDDYHVSEETLNEMGIFRYAPLVGFVFLLLAAVVIFAFQEVFYGIVLGGIASVCFVVYKASFLVVKVKDVVEHFI